MKTTDLAIIFVAIMLPIVVVVYVDVTFLLKKEEQTLYYTNIINSAINDATYAMKNVESEEQDVDYGYSGISDKRVSVNARIAVKAFYESLYDNFDVKGDSTGEAYIKSHIPAFAVIDYNGVYIYSIDEYKDTESGEIYTDYVLKPKRYFTYTYAIEGNKIIEKEEFESHEGIESLSTITVQFTMDDYVMVVEENGVINGFYLEDNNNNQELYKNINTIRDKVIQHLRIKRSEIISDIVSKEMSFAVSNHNIYSDVDYEFVFPTIAMSDWEEMVDNVGIIAFIQGINIGNTKLDYVAHGISGLKMTSRYYVSKATSGVSSLDYYHETPDCTVYLNSNKDFVGYYMSKIEAATAGYYPCPVCSHTVAKNIGGSGTMPANTEETTTTVDWDIISGVDITKPTPIRSGISAQEQGVQIGDYVNYTPEEKTSSKYQTYKDEYTPRSGKYFSTQKGAKALRWQYMGIDDKGNALLVAEKTTDDLIYMYGAEGYLKGVKDLNTLCKELYSSSFGEARSINIDDINKLLDTHPVPVFWIYQNGIREIQNSAYKSVAELAYSFGSVNNGYLVYTKTPDGNDGLEYMYKYIEDYYLLRVSDYVDYTNSVAKIIMNADNYWLASSCVSLYLTGDASMARFGLRTFFRNSGFYNMFFGYESGLFLSNGTEQGYAFAVRPVIVLNPDIEFDKKVDGIWKLK